MVSQLSYAQPTHRMLQQDYLLFVKFLQALLKTRFLCFCQLFLILDINAFNFGVFSFLLNFFVETKDVPELYLWWYSFSETESYLNDFFQRFVFDVFTIVLFNVDALQKVHNYLDLF